MGIELFERAASAGGRILRAEEWTAAAGAEVGRAAGYLLTFDVGRILVAAEPSTGTLRVSELADPAALAGALRGLEEEEPWWRVLGNPITRVWPGADGAGATTARNEEVKDVRIQFRPDDENPRVISLCFDAGRVRVALEASRGR